MKRGFICGVFDLFHIGHIWAFKDCRQHCDHLTVALNSAENIDFTINPGKESPIFSLEERIEILSECKLVDQVISYSGESELMEILQEGKFDVRFLGDDYRDKKITGKELTKSIHFLNRDHGRSTSFYKSIIRQDLR